VLNLDALEESDEIMEDQSLRHQEDAFDYGGISLDVGRASPGGADAAVQDEWDPLNFY